MNDFAFDLFEKLNKDKNIFFSPLSIQICLGMLIPGANGETKELLNKVLGKIADSKDLKGINVVNSLWGNEKIEFKKTFVNELKNNFKANVETINCASPKQAAKQINDFISTNTNDKIKDLVSSQAINDSTTLILTNAIYFKMNWEQQFDPKNTEEKPWNEDQKAKMMRKKEKFNYFENDKLQAVELPYEKSKFSMLVILPKLNVNISINQNVYKSVTDSLVLEEVDVYLPKFKLEYSKTFNDSLSALGLDVIFTSKADFSNIMDSKTLVSQVVHKAFVEVDEKGTEAAAATAVTMMRSIRFRKVNTFNADRPFYFMIRNHETNDVVFMGRLVNV